jgi:hypothetical protein
MYKIFSSKDNFFYDITSSKKEAKQIKKQWSKLFAKKVKIKINKIKD